MEFKLETSTKIILKVIGLVLALAFLWTIRDVVIILLLAIVLASALEPLVDYLNRKKIPRAVSVLAVYILAFALVGIVVWLLVPPLVGQFNNLLTNLPDLTRQLQERMPNLNLIFGKIDLKSIGQQLVNVTAGEGTIFTRTVGVFNGLFTVITVLVISFYLVATEKGMKKLIKDLVPAPYEDFATNLVEKIQKKMGLWVLGQLILSLFIFALTFIGLSLLGVKYALFLALLAGLLEIVPYIGPFLSAVPAIFVALVQSPPLAVFVILLYIIIQKTEGYVLVPKIMEKTIGTSPLVVLLSLLIGFKLAGILGLLLAVPLAGAAMVVIHEYWPAQSSDKTELVP